MADHLTKCPACGSNLYVYVFPHQGGGVEENVGLASAGTPTSQAASLLAEAQASVDKANQELAKAAKAALAVATPSVAATPAAVAHAEELGVPLAQVEGTGSGGTITKADVAAVATSQPAEEAPANG